MSDVEPAFFALTASLLDRHPRSLPPAVWGPLIAGGLRSIEDVERVLTATIDVWARREILCAVARVVDADRARVLLQRSQTSWPPVGLAELAITAGEPERAAEHIRGGLAESYIDNAIALIHALPEALRAPLIALAAEAIARDPLERISSARELARCGADRTAASLGPVLAEIERTLAEAEPSLYWDAYSGEEDPRLVLAETYGALARAEDARRWIARAEALPYPSKPKHPAGPTEASRASRAQIDGAPRPPKPTPALPDLAEAARALGGITDRKAWIDALVASACVVSAGPAKEALLSIALRLAARDPWLELPVLAAGYGGDVAFGGFADFLASRPDAGDVHRVAPAIVAAPAKIAERMARQLLTSLRAADVQPSSPDYRIVAIRSVLGVFGDRAADVWRTLGLPIDDASLEVLPRGIAETELARRAAQGADLTSRVRLASSASAANLDGADGVRRGLVAEVTARLRTAEPGAIGPIVTDQVFPLVADASSTELSAIVDALADVGQLKDAYWIFDRALALGDHVLMARTGAVRFHADPSNEHMDAAYRVWCARDAGEISAILATTKLAQNVVHLAIVGRGFTMDYLRAVIGGATSPSTLGLIDAFTVRFPIDGAAVNLLLRDHFSRCPPPIVATECAALPALVRCYALLGAGEPALEGLARAVAARL